MQPFNELARKWGQFGQGELTRERYPLKLTTDDTATLAQLYCSYPRLSEDEILRDLLAAALYDLEQAIPYKQGNKVIAFDECGDEIFEDSGLTPRFLRLTKQHQTKLRQPTNASLTK